MSQTVDVSVVVQGMAELVRAIVESGFQHEPEKEFQDEDGRTHAVDLVVRDESGTKVGVKVDAKSGVATFVGHDRKTTAVANRVAQRYAYSKALDDLRRKGYQIVKDEKQKDGTIKLVAQRWR